MRRLEYCLETLSGQTGRVEKISDVSQPPATSQPGEPLGIREFVVVSYEGIYIL